MGLKETSLVSRSRGLAADMPWLPPASLSLCRSPWHHQTRLTMGSACRLPSLLCEAATWGGTNTSSLFFCPKACLSPPVPLLRQMWMFPGEAALLGEICV